MLEERNPLTTDDGRKMTARPAHLHPQNPGCPLHLRRVCGTCSAFGGSGLRDKAQKCNRLQITVNGTKNAARCKRWARK